VLPARDSYLGLMVEEITMQPLHEPYRIFTSRSPWRLELRMSNAEARLSGIAADAGLIDEARRTVLGDRQRRLDEVAVLLASRLIEPAAAADLTGGPVQGRISLEQALKRPEVRLETLSGLAPEIGSLDSLARIELEARIKYAGYAVRQERELELLERFQGMALSPAFLERLPAAVSTEARLRIAAVNPATLGELSRIPGVRAADVAAILAALKASSDRPEK
ncbi:MAG TPA: hypothetical protein VIV61_02935, partial [Candidatus Ozemobacteraceae bacterium]